MKEKVIRGVLHYRDDEFCEWKPFTIESLTTAFIAMRREYEETNTKLNKINACINEFQTVINVAKSIK